MFKFIMAAFAALYVASAHAVVDPTMPPVELRTASATATVATEPLTLQGVLGGRTPRAVINGVSVPVGKEVAGARVISIRSNTVLVERQGQREWLRLAPTILQLSR
ncbi:Type II secretory pathway component [Pseudomonas matsuisoli]|uniref:MSHA biogenesis protein MshK n=1 Tax=Pseudomonas matsuisoli TaxID=1515666 RepID=A0A917Q0Z1_9PSED|nr:Type II secretory pathway component [Pseudomonas matsuisoli]GGK04364.1 hypothetical protein GCM10009304_32990 [Pseudomonas matsuisoli]